MDPNIPEKPWRLVFFGSAAFSIPSLRALLKGGDEVSLVVSVPPRPAGRGRKLTPVPVTLFAREEGLPLLESSRPNDPEIVDFIASLEPDLLVVAAFGALLGKNLLSLGRTPPLNVHPSLLPRHRGAAPVNWAVIQGDLETGVSVMFLDEGMDTGPILARRPRPVPPGTGAVALQALLAQDGAALLSETILQIKAGTHVAVPQDPEKATVNRLLVKTDGKVDFSKGAAAIASLINGLEPWPGARALLNGKTVQFFGAGVAPGDGAPGEVLGLTPEGELKIATPTGTLLVREVQMEGKKRVAAAEFTKGYRPKLFEPPA